MSTVSGVFPNAITPTFAATTDQAVQNRLRRENETAVFLPIDEAEATVQSRSTNQEQPGRLEAESQVNTASQTKSSEQSAGVETASESVTVEESSQVASAQGATIDSDQVDAEKAQLEEDIQLIRELAARDQEVKAHEQAHQTTGGQYAGSMAFTYQEGPDGKRYAVGGEVPIDISVVPGDPEATAAKADKIRAAALAPAEPSNQDQQVAAMASQIALEAQTEIRQEAVQQAEIERAQRLEQRDIASQSEDAVAASSKDEQESSDSAAEETDQRMQDILEQTKSTVMAALEAAYNTQHLTEIGFNLDTTV